MAFIGLNPSVANESEDDQTIRKCIGFAQRWNFGGLLMLNLYGFCSTLPSRMWLHHKRGGDIVGGERNYVASLKHYAEHLGVQQVIAAWGNDKLGRERTMRSSGWKLDCLKLNNDGSPGHPLYLPYLAERRPWNY